MRRSYSIAATAVLALALSACGNGDDGGDAAAAGGDPTTSIEILGTDSLDFDRTAFTVPVGEEVTVELTSEPAVEHDFVLEDVDGQDVEVVHADPGETETGTFTLDDTGTYTFFCSVPGHRQAGMEGTVAVVD
jgi:uncharacterized cupredoxin-like copper-binding protein